LECDKLTWPKIERIRNEQGATIVYQFLATWCPPCIQEMPSIEKLYGEFKNEVVFLCISDERLSKIKKFKETKKYTFPMYKLDGNRPAQFMSRGIPATFIVSDGKILLKHIGGANWAHKKVSEFIKDKLHHNAEQND